MKRGAKLAALVTAVVMILSACGKVPSGTQGSDKSGGTQIKKEKSPYADTVIEWKEPVLEDAVREILQKPDGDIRGEELEDITELSLSGTGIYDTDDLIYFVNLETLDLFDNRISSLAPLSALKNLRYLNLNGTQISDISALGSLAGLRVLEMEQVPVKQTGSLSALCELRYFSAPDSWIADASGLAGLEKLEYLALKKGGRMQSATDIEPLKILVHCQKMQVCTPTAEERSELTSALPHSKFVTGYLHS